MVPIWILGTTYSERCYKLLPEYWIFTGLERGFVHIQIKLFHGIGILELRESGIPIFSARGQSCGISDLTGDRDMSVECMKLAL